MVIAVTFFIFALLIGVAVIGRVPATLHTPLMSGANSIHGVVVVGVIIVASQTDTLFGNLVVFFAALFGTLNVVGGYVVTDRMLEMFKPKKEEPKFKADLGDDTLDDDGAFSVQITEKKVVKADAVGKTPAQTLEDDLKDDPILAKTVISDETKGAIV
jgi:NAD(P) transhydrogenase subunit alpha